MYTSVYIVFSDNSQLAEHIIIIINEQLFSLGLVVDDATAAQHLENKHSFTHWVVSRG